MFTKLLFAVFISASLFLGAQAGQDTKKTHGIAMHGQPKYSAGFKNYDFVKPNAPKKGRVVLGEVGSFDSLNPWILKGVAAKRIPLTRTTLLGRSPEEPFTLYGVVAESLEYPENRAWVIFNLRASAKWENGKPITADDIIFSYETWLEQGQPFMKTFYKKVQKVEKLSNQRVKFTFDPEKADREVPLIMGMMPLLPKEVYK
ncbi:MAG: ABC transporter substrate-binding protein, partial [Alphaproteobacteria bacterium]